MHPIVNISENEPTVAKRFFGVGLKKGCNLNSLLVMRQIMEKR